MFSCTHRRRGAVTVFVVVLLVVIFGFAALAIDVGYIANAAADAQNEADAAALAGASILSSGSDSDAQAEALRVLQINQNLHVAPSWAANVIETGTWDQASESFTVGAVGPGGSNAVRVVSLREDMPLWFAGILGINETTVSREAVASANLPQGCRMWGIDGVVMSGGSKTDSYSSSQGAYSLATAGSDGDVCSCKDISLSGSLTLIDGDVFHGNAYTFSASGGASATGTVGIISECINPIPDFGDVAINNDNGTIGFSDGGNDPLSGGSTNFNLSGTDHITLDPGRYYFTEFTLSGGSTISVTGPTTFYIDGKVTVSGGGVVNTTQNPQDFAMISSGTDVSWSGDSDYYGSLLAPYAKVTISGGGDFYGTGIGKEISITGGGDFHADLSLPPDGKGVPPPVLVR